MYDQALEDVRILDFTQMMQGPWATQKLADMGADVVKVERRGTGEWERSLKVGGELLEGESPYFHAMNRNKRSVTVDLKSDRGRELCLELGEDADVVVNNFRPGVMDRLGLGYEDFTAVNEEVIYCQASGYGATGPYAEDEKPGQDLLIQALTGITYLQGEDDDPPTPIGTSIVDEHAASTLAFGIVTALFHKERTGEGQFVDSSLFNAGIDFQTQELTAYMNVDELGDISEQRSSAGIGQPWAPAPYGIYETADGYVAIAYADLETLAELMEIPELDEYDEAAGDDWTHRDEIKRLVEAETPARTTQEWLDVLEPADVWCAPVRGYEGLLEDPQVEHNGMVQTVEHPELGELDLPGVPVNMSETPGAVETPPPMVGEHTDEVLEAAGYDEAEIEALREEEVI